MNGKRSREIAAAMELVVEAENMELKGDEMYGYVKDRLQERFPEAGSLTVHVISSEVIKMRVKGMW